jgi:hypothetical protein
MIKKYNLDKSLVNYIDNLGMGVEARGAIGGTVYYVEGNSGNDARDGKSIDTAFKTLACALAASHADMARRARWARRNTIYVFGDSLTEDLTKMAQKTDIVGLGSCDYLHTARLIGAHHIGDVGYDGCRWINMGFKGTAAACDMFILNNYHNGTAFLNCDFNGDTAAAALAAIVATATESLTIKGCVFDGPFSDAVIELGTGETNSLLIQGNIISGANEGIHAGAVTTTVRAGWIIGNYIKSTLACINDESSKLHIVGNRGITLAVHGSSQAGAVVGNVALSADNIFTTADGGTCTWPLLLFTNPT